MKNETKEISDILSQIGAVCLIIVIWSIVFTLGLIITGLSIALTLVPFVLAYKFLVWIF